MQESHKPLWMLGVALLVGIGGILYGYDIGVISGALLFIFQSIPMSDAQTGIIVGAVLAGGLAGTIIAGPLADELGRRIVIALSSVIFILGVSLVLLANSFLMILIARLLLGIGVGIVAVAVPLYVTELVPRENRGKYVAFFQLFLTFGILLAYFVDFLLTPSGNWRLMFAVVLVPAFILLIGVLNLPESPRWLVAKGKIDKARTILYRTRTKARAEAALIRIQEGIVRTEGSWRELFSRSLFLPLFIGVVVAILNQWTGINIFLQYAPDILKRAGLGSNMVSMLGSVGIGMINFVCTIVALLLIDKVGRKPLLIFGVIGILISEVFLGLVNGSSMVSSTIGILSLIGLLGFTISFAVGPGVVVWLAISELLPTRVRGKGMALCLFFSSLSGFMISSAFPILRNWLGISGTYWLCSGFAFLYVLVTIFLLPETKAQSLEDIQRYFQNQVEAETMRITEV